jgi:hypothetical protein
MLNLPDVTLVTVETRAHELARIAINDCLSKVSFGDVIIYTDKPEQFREYNTSYVPDWPTKASFCEFSMFEAFKPVTTSHILYVEWDGGIWQSDMWTDDFLQYDYVGAVWPWCKAPYNVGNGGFSLRSKRLYDYMVKFSKAPWTDAQLCLTERVEAEKQGFKWAPDYVAHTFAFERLQPTVGSRHFGFHGIFNWPKVLSRANLIERTKIAARNPYVNSTNMVKALLQIVPWLKQEIVV